MVNRSSESGVGLRSRPRIAKQSRKIRQMAGRACSYQTAVGFFIGPRRLFAAIDGLNWRKLFENGIKPVRQNGVQRPKRAFGAELEAAEASNVPPLFVKFLFAYVLIRI